MGLKKEITGCGVSWVVAERLGGEVCCHAEHSWAKPVGQSHPGDLPDPEKDPDLLDRPCSVDRGGRAVALRVLQGRGG